MIIHQMTDLIGNTPLLRLPSNVTGLKNIDLYAKLEMMNPFGSVKDRTVWAMIKDDIADIKSKDKTIYENSSGNSAKSLQAIANIHGLKFHLVSALAKVEEQKEILQIMGAEIEEIAGASDCFDTTDPNDPQYIIERRVSENPEITYFPNQFSNPKNPSFHEETTGREIVDDLGCVDYFFCGLGTTGTSLGVATALRKVNPQLKTVGITAKPGHFIPGIRTSGQMMESILYRQDYFEEIYPITEEETVEGMMTLIRNAGVLAGPTSGANFSAALTYLKKIDAQAARGTKAVFIVCDRMEWYVSYIRDRRPEIFGGQARSNTLSQFDSADVMIVPEVAAQDLDTWRINNPNHLIIDIRTPHSFTLVNIPGSINMPQEQFIKWIDGNNHAIMPPIWLAGI